MALINNDNPKDEKKSKLDATSYYLTAITWLLVKLELERLTCYLICYYNSWIMIGVWYTQ